MIPTTSRTYQQKNSRRGRGFVVHASIVSIVLLVVGFGLLMIKSSRAELEVPVISPVGYAQSDINGLYAYFRTSREATTNSPDDPTGYPLQEYYEAWAVGRNQNAASAEKGVVYRFRGDQWERISVGSCTNNCVNDRTRACRVDTDCPVGLNRVCDNDNYDTACVANSDCASAGGMCINRADQSFNATFGRYFGSGFSSLWMVGDQGSVVYKWNGHADEIPGITEQRQYERGRLDANVNCPGGVPARTNALLSGAAVQGYYEQALIGGINGLLAQHYCDSGSPSPGCTATSGDVWRQACPAGFPAVNEHVTGIAVSQNKTFYITTTTATDTVGPPGTMDLQDIHACAGGTGRLYKYAQTSDGIGSLTLLGSQNTCFFGLTVQTIPFANTPLNGPLYNTIWVASANGVYRWDEWWTGNWSNGVTPMTGTAGQKVFAVTASTIASGSGMNLLRNGNFEAWRSTSPTASSNIEPDGWTKVVGAGRNNDANSCGTTDINSNTRDVRASGPGEATAGSQQALRIQTAVHYESLGQCQTAFASDRHDYFTSIAFTRIDLTNIDASKFVVSGKYKVEFYDPKLSDPRTGAPDPLNPPAPAYAQGGFFTSCPGGLFSPNRRTVDCSFSNRQQIRTVSQGNTVNDQQHDAKGYIPFSFVISNQNTQYDSILGMNNNPRPPTAGVILELGCEGTYGTRVWCDDLKVEAVNTPSFPSTYRTQVTAVGVNGTAWRNENGLIIASNIFVAEPNPAAGTDAFYAVTAAGNQFAGTGDQYIYAAGANGILSQRSPGNINGYLWGGTAGPGNSGRVGLGWLSTTCSNVRDASGRTLCQRGSLGYGLTLDRSPSGTTDILSGRAWLGKNYSAGATVDRESLNLGRCLNPITKAANPATAPYRVTGTCNTATRTCAGDQNHACTRDFDCYGRCEQDQGFVCLYNSDCQIGATPKPTCDTTDPSTCTNVNSILNTLPKNRIQCTDSGGSALACTAGGWLSFTPSDFPVPPPAAIQASAIPAGQRNYCVGGGACTDATLCPDGQRCKIKGVGRFLTLANTTDPNYAANRGWVSLRGPDASPVTTPINGSCDTDPPRRCYGDSGQPCLSEVQCQNLPMLFGCRSCATDASTGGNYATDNDLDCAFCQDQNSQSCTPDNSAGGRSCYYYCNGDPLQPACLNDVSCSVGISCDGTNQCVGGSNAGGYCTVATVTTDCPAYACKPVGRCSQNGAIDCSTNANCTAVNAGYCSIGALCQPRTSPPYTPAEVAASCQTYGVNLDSQNRTFNGYAWSADYGWLDYHTIRLGASRFIQTRLGDIYSQQRIGDTSTQLPPGNTCNATYVISAGGTISNFCSALIVPGRPVNYQTVQQYAPFIPFASQQNRFANALGQFDLAGMETVTTTAPDPYNSNQSTNVNKYKSFVHTLGTSTVLGYRDLTTCNPDTSSCAATDMLTYLASSTRTRPLQSRVLIAGDANTRPGGSTCGADGCWFRMDRNFKVADGGSGATEGPGNGMIIINGNLRINGDIETRRKSIADLRFLGSLVIVVRGDLAIDSTVGNLSAAFYVTGTVCTAPRGSTNPARCTTDPQPFVAGTNKYPLVIRGLMIAHEFVFARRFAGTADDPRPSELIIYDGRVQANPMPGTTDFANALPSSVRIGF